MDDVRANLREWLEERPPHVRSLAVRFPPGATVKAKDGQVLMVPAPGVTGEVYSYFENGCVGVVAPLAADVDSPITAWHGEEGQMVRAQVRADCLELVDYRVLDGTAVSCELVADVVAALT